MSNRAKRLTPGQKFVLDLGPLLVFFLAYRTSGLLAATAALIVCTLFSLLIIYVREKRLATMPLITAIAVTIFGGLTLWLQDEQFIKMKPTIVNSIFAMILLGGVMMGKPLIKYLLAEAMHLTDEGWLILSRRWGWFFVFLAVLNEFIWRSFSTDFWVNFKVFGMFTCTLVFTFAQIPLIKRYWVDVPKED